MGASVESVVALDLLDITCWQGGISPEHAAQAANTLESGRLLYAPRLRFALMVGEGRFLSPNCLDGKSKNVSLRPGQPR